jgi:5'-phosphate synthase pdxT subunit
LVSVERVGVLALQGGFEAHAKALAALDADAVEVRRPRALASLAGLILPGGETTTLLNLMRDEPWFEELKRFHAAGGVLWGTCAGAILLSRQVIEPAQPSLGLLDAVIARNAFGRQVDSFEALLDVRGQREPLRAIFIRAPRFRSLGSQVEVLSRWEDEPVLVRQGRVLACTFHPELTGDVRLHRMFLELVAAAGADAPDAPRSVMAR